jgi:drug/metabolite transporter (DMT)-like permease
MKRFGERIGGYRRYTWAIVIALAGVAILYWPGGLSTDTQRSPMIMLGATLVVGAVGWVFLTLDRQVSDDPRYQRPVYTEEDDPDPGD